MQLVIASCAFSRVIGVLGSGGNDEVRIDEVAKSSLNCRKDIRE